MFSFYFDFSLLRAASSMDILREGLNGLRSGRTECLGEGGAVEKMEVSVCLVDVLCMSMVLS